MINKLGNINTNTFPSSVYNLSGYSLEELLCSFYEHINKAIDLTNSNEENIKNQNLTINNFIEYMKNEGIPPIVIETITTMYNDGRLQNLFNTMFNNIFTNLEEFKTLTTTNFNLLNDKKANKDDVAKITMGTPKFVNDISEMKDTTRIYVNLNDGFVYLHNGETFEKTSIKYQEKGISDGEIEINNINQVDLNSLTNLNKNNLFDNALFKPNKLIWKLGTNTTYNDLIKIDGYNTVRLNKNNGETNNHIYQTIKNLEDNQEYFISCFVNAPKKQNVLIQVFYYKSGQNMKTKQVEFICDEGTREISTTFITDNTICDEYRITFTLKTEGELFISKPFMCLNNIEFKKFDINDSIKKVMFNPNNLNNEEGIPSNWTSLTSLCEYSNVKIDGFKTLKVETTEGVAITPYKAIVLPSDLQGYNGDNNVSMKVKVELKEGYNYPVTISVMNLNYIVGTTSGAKTTTKNYIIEKDGVYTLEVDNTSNNLGRIHAAFKISSESVKCYINQLTVTLGKGNQPHFIKDLFSEYTKIKSLEESINSNGENDNFLFNKILTFNGDSIMAGAGFTGGFAKMLCDKHGAIYENKAIGGGTIASNTYYTTDKYPELSEDKPRHWICKTIENMRSDADYCILEGGINDYYNNVKLGEITKDYNSPFDETSFCGAFESMLKQTILKYQGKKYGFIITHKINNTFYPYGNSASGKFEMYYNKMIEMLEKWSFPYLDLFKCSGLNVNLSEIKSKYTKDGDGVHPNELGYKLYYLDKVENWIKSL